MLFNYYSRNLNPIYPLSKTTRYFLFREIVSFLTLLYTTVAEIQRLYIFSILFSRENIILTQEHSKMIMYMKILHSMYDRHIFFTKKEICALSGFRLWYYLHTHKSRKGKESVYTCKKGSITFLSTIKKWEVIIQFRQESLGVHLGPF